MSDPKVSIITICKGRLSHLKKQLPTLLKQTYSNFEVIVVAYGDQETVEYCKSFNDEKLKCIDVKFNTDEFSLSRSRNIGGVLATGEYLAFTDCDYFYTSNYLQSSMEIISDCGMLNVKKHDPDSYCGACIVKTEIFDYVRGFDENFKGYGYEDADFYRRVWDETGSPILIHYPDIGYICYDQYESVKNFTEKDMEASKAANLKIRELRTGRVNDFGFGLTGEENNDINALKRRYPYIKERPYVHMNPGLRTWDERTIKDNVLALLDENTKLIIEVGSWNGWSAVQMLRKASNATIICIDTWTGFAGYTARLKGAHEPFIYEKFLDNCWDYKDRIIHMKCHSGSGLRELGNLRINPDLIYIDGDHDKDVYDDIDASCNLFPNSIITGDDYTWASGSVKDAVKKSATKYQRDIIENNDFWRLVK